MAFANKAICSETGPSALVGTTELRGIGRMAFAGRRVLLGNGFPFDSALGERFAQGRPSLRSE